MDERRREDTDKGLITKTEQQNNRKRRSENHFISNRQSWPPVIDDEIIKLCIEEFREATSSKVLSFVCCAVCGMESKEFEVKHVNNIPNKHDKHVLSAFDGKHMLEEYRHFGLILVSHGLDGSNANCCLECLGCLKNGHLPPCSAANRMQFGSTPPALRGFKIAEKLLIGIVHPSVHVIKFRDIWTRYKSKTSKGEYNFFSPKPC